jgi:hypothetical protein
MIITSCSYQDKAKFIEPLKSPLTNNDEKDKQKTNDTISSGKVSKEQYEQALQSFYNLYVQSTSTESEDTAVDYQKLHDDIKAEDEKTLELILTIKTYISKYDDLGSDQADTDPIQLRNDNIALYINAYNFYVIEAIGRNYINPDSGQPIEKISDVCNCGSGFFKKIQYIVANKKMSLDALEKHYLYSAVTKEAKPDTAQSTFTILKVLRYDEKGKPVTSCDDIASDKLVEGNEATNECGTKVTTLEPKAIDARFHFAVICGAKGCPVLSKGIFKGESIEEQLSEITKIGLKQARNLEYVNASEVVLTQLFDWYKMDFSRHSLSSLENSETSELQVTQADDENVDVSAPKNIDTVEPTISEVTTTDALGFIRAHYEDTINDDAQLKIKSSYCWDLNSVENAGVSTCKHTFL